MSEKYYCSDCEECNDYPCKDPDDCNNFVWLEWLKRRREELKDE